MLRLENISKSYGKTLALDGLNLEIEKGCIYGFVGPNGAGKTTTMKLVTGLLRPDSGKIFLGGQELVPQSDDIRKRIGYMPDFFGVYDNLLVREYLQFFGELYELTTAQIETKTKELLELVQLTDKIDEPVDALSRGMKQRLCLARALIHEPELLLLDEPASGMDPIARIQMKEILKSLSQMGQTILISSHILPELSEICTIIGIINNGKMIQQGTMATLDMALRDTLKIQIKYLENTEVAELEGVLTKTPNIEAWHRIDSKTIAIELAGNEADAAELMKNLCLKTNVYHFQIVEDSLETLFKKAITEGSESAHEA